MAETRQGIGEKMGPLRDDSGMKKGGEEVFVRVRGRSQVLLEIVNHPSIRLRSSAENGEAPSVWRWDSTCPSCPTLLPKPLSVAFQIDIQ